MNSFLSISFAFLFLIKGMMPGMDLSCELQKLPNLFEHYQEHKVCNDGSFSDFLINDFLHGGDFAQDHKESEHENLPFHGSHNCFHQAFFYTNEQHFLIIVLGFITSETFAVYNTFFSSLFPDSPSQPPRA